MTTCARADAGAWFNYPFLTSKERDIETGLDYAHARYYANAQGRFTGVDPLTASASPLQPQSWNRYVYCINNPLVFVDPSGMIWGTKSNGNGTATAQWFDTTEEMEEAGFSAMTNFLARNPNGDGYVSFDRFSNHAESISTLAVVGGLFSGETIMRQQGVTSQSAPLFHLTDPVANSLNAIYKDPNVQGILNSQEAHFLSIYLGVAGVEFAAMQAFSEARAGLSMAGKAFELRFVGRHLPGAAKSGQEAHMFNDLSTMSRVESEIFSRGIYTGTRDGFARFGLQFEQPIGTRIGKDGAKTVLDYGQLKLRDNGLYHVVPRRGPGPQ